MGIIIYMDCQFGSVNDCVTTDSTVYLIYNVILCSFRNKLISAHCTGTSNVFTVADENLKRCIFLMFRGLFGTVLLESLFK